MFVIADDEEECREERKPSLSTVRGKENERKGKEKGLPLNTMHAALRSVSLRYARKDSVVMQAVFFPGLQDCSMLLARSRLIAVMEEV
jgi:hypothetical protein